MGYRLTSNAGEALRTAGSLSTVGLAFVLALVLGFWFGSLLDQWIGTKPVFTVIFFFLGLAAGILNVYRIVSQAYPRSAARTSPADSVPAHSRPPEPPQGPDAVELHDDDR